MSDLQTSTGNGAGTATAAKAKRARAAVTAIDGSNIHIKFEPRVGGGELHLDTSKIPGAESLTGSARHIFNHGVVGIVQGSYSNVETGYHKTAKAMADKLLAGTYTPGRGRPAEAKEPDELILALSEHLKLSNEAAEKYIEKYANHHKFVSTKGGPGLAQARRALRANHAVAPIIARIVADRAKRVVQSAQKAPKEDLAAVL